MESEREQKNPRKDDDSNDHQLNEFLEVMQPRIKSKLWANDTLATPVVDQNNKVREKKTARKKERTEKSAAEPMESDEDDNAEYGASDRQATDNEQSPARDDVISDVDYFRSRVKKNWSASDSSDSDDDIDDKRSLYESTKELDVQEVPNGQFNSLKMDDAGKEDKRQGSEEDHTGEMRDQDEKEAIETSRLFVRNLPYTATYLSSFNVYGLFYDESPVQQMFNN